MLQVDVLYDNTIFQVYNIYVLRKTNLTKVNVRLMFLE
jgi:hypothetical protein